MSVPFCCCIGLEKLFEIMGCGLMRKASVFLGKCLSGSIWVGLCQRRLVVGQGHLMGTGQGFKWKVQKAKRSRPVWLVELDLQHKCS
jgi:hypothetical protein